MNSTKIALLAGAALAVAMGSLPAIAQPGPGSGPSRPAPGGRGFAVGEAFARADANNDGRVTQDEGWAWLQARFQEADADHNGGVTMEEMRAFAQARMGEHRMGRSAERGAANGGVANGGVASGMDRQGQSMFRALDANGDGKVTQDEIRPFAEAMFRARDANSDGALTRDEVRAQNRGSRHGQHHRRGDGQRGAPAPVAPAN